MKPTLAGSVFIPSALAVLSFGLLGCPSLGRAGGDCQFTPLQNWNSRHFGWEQAPYLSCPLDVQRGGEYKTYGAAVNGPFDQITPGGQLRTEIYADDHFSWRGGSGATFRNTGGNIGKADISVVYFAGYETPYGQYYSDYADNSVPLWSGGYALSEVALTYRLYSLAALSGSASPTPGTNATWTASGFLHHFRRHFHLTTMECRRCHDQAREPYGGTATSSS